MTTLREAAQQALEALEKATGHMSDAEIRKFNECAIALNAAMRAENKMRHLCSLDSPSDVYGIAMDICYEGDDGTYWVSNDEYASQVNYCPVCGAKAPKQAEQRPLTDVTEAVTKTVIETEKLLCEKIGRQWQPSGMSIRTLVDELATLVAERERETCAIAGGAAAMAGLDHLQVAAAIRARGEI